MDKKELRQHIRALKRTFSREDLDAMSREVCRRVAALPQWQEAHCLLLYHPLPDEVDTRWLIDEALRLGKTVLLPVVVGDDLQLHIHTSVSDLQPGAFDILEPTGDVFLDYPSIDLAIIPGMAFDADGHRLGRGKGYYDRLLPRLSAIKMGVCFPFQLVDHVPTDAHDVGMDMVCQ